jgi:hypothetical protein
VKPLQAIAFYISFNADKSISSHELDEAPGSPFFHPDGEKRSSRAPGSSFSPGFGLSSIWRAQAIPAPGARSGSPLEKNMRETPRKVLARLVDPTYRRERAVVILIASSSARCKSLPPTDVQPRDEAS